MATSFVNPYVIDIEEFATWLLSHPADAIIGTAGDGAENPLARFLNEQYQGSTFVVHTRDYERLMDDVSLGVEPEAVFPLPTWAQRFTNLVDPWDSSHDGVPVSAFEACSSLALACQRSGLVFVGGGQ